MSITYDDVAKTVTIHGTTEKIEDVIDTIEAVNTTNAHRDNDYGWIKDVLIIIDSGATFKITADFEWAMRDSTYLTWNGHIYLDERSVTRIETNVTRLETNIGMSDTASFSSIRDYKNGINPRIVYANSARFDFPTLLKSKNPVLFNITGMDMVSLTSATSYYKLYFGNATTVTAENIRYLGVTGTSGPQYYNTTYNDFAVNTLKLVSESTLNNVTFNDPVFEMSSDQAFNNAWRRAVFTFNNPTYPGAGTWDRTLNKGDVRDGSKFYYQFGDNITVKNGLTALQNMQVEWTRADVGTPTFTEPNDSYNALTDSNGQADQLLLDAYSEELTNSLDEYSWSLKIRKYDYRTFSDFVYTVRKMYLTEEVTEEFQTEDITSTLGSISQSTASGYTGITIDGVNKKITVTSASHDIVNIWAYYRNFISTLANFSVVDAIDSDGTDLTLSDWTYKNANSVSGALIGGTIEWDTPATYNWGTFNSNTFDFTANGTYDFGGSTFTGSAVHLDTSNNSTVTVQLDSGVSYVNDNPTYITVEQTVAHTGLSFTGLQTGTQVYVFETGTQTVVDYVESTTGSTFLWQEDYVSDQTVDYTIMKEGYFPIRVTGVTASSSVVTVPVQQKEDRAYQTSSGLAFGTTATVNTSTKEFAVTVLTTVQNWYSFMIESWRSESTLKNVAFPISTNGPNSFSLNDDWEWDGTSSIDLLSNDGFRYVNASGTITAIYSAIQVLGTTYSIPVKYQQVEGTGTQLETDLNGMLQVYGDSTHGNFDYTGYLILKIQADGYDQAEFNVVDTYGTLEDQFYVTSLNPNPNGLTTGDPSVTGVTITDHGASPVTWNGLSYSITIQDSAAGHTGEEIMRWIRYNVGQNITFQGKDAFNWHDLVRTNSSKFKTVNGHIAGGTGLEIKGVRVVKADGTTPHPDFNLFTADDGSTWVPPLKIKITNTNLADGSRCRLINETQSTELDNSLVSGGSGYSYEATVGTGEEIEEGDTITLNVTYNSGSTYYNEITESAVASTVNISFLSSQSNNTVLNGYGIDGSVQTDFATDYPNIQVDINSGDTSREKLLCWLAYITTTADGIRYFFGAIDHQDAGNAIINVSVVDLHLDYVGTGNSQFTDTIWLRRDDGATIFDGSGDNFYANSDKVYVAETGTSGLTPSESAILSGTAQEAQATTNKEEIIKKVKQFS